jgi:UDP-glucose 4-epimerase
MHIGIIGANGFIGSHLAESLSVSDEFKLTLVGRQRESQFKGNASYSSIASVADNELKQIFSNLDVVYYLASSSIPASTWLNPHTEIENNLRPFLHFLDVIADVGVKKVVFVSSAGTIYGPSEARLKEDADKRPFSPHGIMKFTMENFLEYYRRKSGLNYDIYRVSNVFGEGQNTQKGLGLINTLIENIIEKGSVNIYGDGSNLRNYVYVKDVARLLHLSLKGGLSVSNIWNLASSDSFTINQILERLKWWIPVEFTVNYHQRRMSDNPVIDVDNSKILAAYPDFRFTEFQQAIIATYNFIQNSRNLTSSQ